jgi:hypothetical protein
MKREIKLYLGDIGSKGGKSTSPKKVAAAKINIVKATAVRREMYLRKINEKKA